MAKIDRIRQMLQTDPNDLLLNYALALELFQAGQYDESLSQFDKVIGIDPSYSAAYMQKAKALINLDRHREARDVLTAGIQAARQRGDMHAQDKMEELLRAIP